MAFVSLSLDSATDSENGPSDVQGGMEASCIPQNQDLMSLDQLEKTTS